MVFQIDASMLHAGGGIYTGVVVAYGVPTQASGEAMAGLLQEQIARAHADFQGAPVKQSPLLESYHQGFRDMGIHPGKFLCSIEAILTRIAKHGEFPSLGPVVDLGNYISLKYRVPVGVHDIDALEDGALWVRPATEADCQAEPEEKDALAVGEPVYVTGNTVRTRRWLWRQTPAGRVDEHATNLMFPIDGFVGNKEAIDGACAELVQLLQEHFGVTAVAGVVSQADNQFHFGTMSQAEQAVETQLTALLDGVAEHSSKTVLRDALGKALRVKAEASHLRPEVVGKLVQLQAMGHSVIVVADQGFALPEGLESAQVVTPVPLSAEQLMDLASKGLVAELGSATTVADLLKPLVEAYTSVAVEADLAVAGVEHGFTVNLATKLQQAYGQPGQAVLLMPRPKKVEKTIPLVIPALTDGAHGDDIATALVEGGFFKSKGEIRRVFQQGGAALDGERTSDMNALVLTEKTHVLKLGKNKIFQLNIG